MKLVFFGTHHFAKTVLEYLIQSTDVDIEYVVTQPDKPVGRKKILTPPPVKLLAQIHNIPVLQPKSLKNYILPTKESSLSVVSQYGKIIPQSILDSFTLGMINTHTSLLPKYRGASPIQSALIAGEKSTGVTIMKMDVGMDTGPILQQESINILPTETYLDLNNRLADITGPLLYETLQKYIESDITPQAQDETDATSCTLLNRDDGKIDFVHMTAERIFNLYRGLTPWPGIWTIWNDKRLKLLSIALSDEVIDAGKMIVVDNALYIGCSEKSIQVLELQLEGKQKMNAEVFIQGYGRDL
jgi:methionyl-tRNA formyltransferase